MKTPTTEKLVEGEIVNINNSESIGVVRAGKVVDVLEKYTLRMVDDEGITLSSDIASSNAIGYFDKDGNILMYKVYGIVIDMNSSDCDGCIYPYTDCTANMDLGRFINEFLGIRKYIQRGATYYDMNNFYYSYTVTDNTILFLISMGKMDNSYRAFTTYKDTVSIRVGTNVYNERSSVKFTFKDLMLFNSLFWIITRSTDMSRTGIEGLKECSSELYEIFYNISNNIWIYSTSSIDRVPIDAYISKYKKDHDTIIPSEFNGSSKTYLCTRYTCTNSLENKMYFSNNQLFATSNGSQIRNVIEIK